MRLGDAQASHLEQRIRQSFQRARRAFCIGGRLRLRAECRPHDFHRRQLLLDRPFQSVGDGRRVSLPRNGVSVTQTSRGALRGRVAGEAGRVGALTDTCLRFGAHRPLGLHQEPQIRRQIAARAILAQPPSLLLGQPVQCLAMDAEIRSDRVLRLVGVLIAAARVRDGFGREAAVLTAVLHERGQWVDRNMSN